MGLSRGTYKVIATVSGTSTGFADASTVENRQYRYALQAVNAAGKSPSTYTPFFYTSPAAPPP